MFFVPLVLLTILATAYTQIPQAWQLVVRVLVGITVAVLAVYFVLRYRRETRQFAPRRATNDLVWRDGQSVTEFQFALLEHCKDRGWQVVWSAILDAQRVGFGLRKRKRQLVLLCLASDAPVTEEDRRRAEKWRTENDANRGIILTAVQVGSAALLPGPAGLVEMLPYEALYGNQVLY